MYTMWDLYTIIIVLRQKITNKVTYKISLCSVFNMFNNCSSFNLYKAKIVFPLHEIDVNNWSLSVLYNYIYHMLIIFQTKTNYLNIFLWKVLFKIKPNLFLLTVNISSFKFIILFYFSKEEDQYFAFIV
jgi:hypothetical protein